MKLVENDNKIGTRNVIETTLRVMGLNKSYKGFNCLICAIILVMENPDILTYICKGLYVEIAIQCGTTVASVERNIRTAKEVIWRNCNENILRSIFKDQYNSKIPNNANFIDMLTDFIKLIINEEQASL